MINFDSVQRLKKSFLNEYFILALILLNALLIFIQEFNIQSNWIEFTEPVFTIIFFIEMMIKIQTFSFKKYIADGWNRLDFVLVIISLPSIVALFFDNDFANINFFLTLRTLRVFKFFRLIRFFPNINSIVLGVQRAMRASYLIIFGFFTLVFIFSILTCSLYKGIAPEYFGNPLDAFYSIFRIFSIEGWYEIPDIIASRSNPTVAFLTKVYFVLLLLCGGILGLSLVNSIFVDAMVSDNNDDLQKQVEELHKKIDDLTEHIKKLKT